MGPLTGPLLDLAEGVCADNDPYFFSRFSNVYNSHLSMSAVGVDNGRNEGWIRYSEITQSESLAALIIFSTLPVGRVVFSFTSTTQLP